MEITPELAEKVLRGGPDAIAVVRGIYQTHVQKLDALETQARQIQDAAALLPLVWIAASERLPADDQQCLTVDKDGIQRVARFDAIGDGERHSWYEEQEWKSVYPVAWMPLPEPPAQCP